MANKLCFTMLCFCFNLMGLNAQKNTSTADNDFYINDTLRLEPSQIQLVQALPTEIRRTLVFRPKVDGLTKYYFISGYLFSVGEIKNKMQEGIWLSYYDSGCLASKINYINNSKEGACWYYYKTGELNATGQYKNDKKEGEWPFYNKDGTIKGRYFYRNGVIIDVRN